MQNTEIHSDLTWIHFDSIDSTNAYLLDNDHVGNQLVSADHQTAGRGRRQQAWVDERDSLLMSLATTFTPHVDVSAWAIQVAITLAQTLEPLTKKPLKIKWPNDLYTLTSDYQWGKCAGILIESRLGASGKMVTGIGINLSEIPSDINADYPIGYLPTTLAKSQLIPHLGKALLASWQSFIDTPQVSPTTYQTYDLLFGKNLQATDFNQANTQTGVGAGINEQGHLLLRLPNKTIALSNQHRIRIVE